ncbi:unnamed protein product [Tuwongella immobilis]|uniref:Uncharacterized protein n=1 Tax=Tuwongella immobilis TaxID=692036 RepID=A0A6C2YVD9_9BACT|nr:unnamed protein product [Tuwongella immobilis]VTS08515.1 unnamed protein product [Tuwongella immobilis]
MKRIIEAIASESARLARVTKEEHQFLCMMSRENYKSWFCDCQFYLGDGWSVWAHPRPSKAKSQQPEG